MGWDALKHDVLSGLISGFVISAVALGATAVVERRFAEAQERRENLRFVRDVSTREEGPMPFRGMDLRDMNLSGLTLPCRDETSIEVCHVRADFSGADLTGADLSYLQAEGAIFEGAIMHRVDLTSADLAGVNLLGAQLDGATLTGVCYSATTIWPADFTPPESMDSFECTLPY